MMRTAAPKTNSPLRPSARFAGWQRADGRCEARGTMNGRLR